MEDNKLVPFQRLKAIIKGDDVILTEKSMKNLDRILGEENNNESIFTKFINFLKSIDSKIFIKQSRIYRNKYSRRK